MILEGDKVLLKKVIMEDADDEYLSWLNDDEVTRALETVPKPYTMEMLKKYLSDVMANENTFKFMITDKISGEKIGTIKIHSINQRNGTCNLGFMIGNKKFWGKGYGWDAFKTALDFAFDQLHIRKIGEAVNSNNDASLALFKKAGFEIEGVLKEQVFSNGEYVDKVLLGLLAKNRKK